MEKEVEYLEKLVRRVYKKHAEVFSEIANRLSSENPILARAISETKCKDFDEVEKNDPLFGSIYRGFVYLLYYVMQGKYDRASTILNNLREEIFDSVGSTPPYYREIIRDIMDKCAKELITEEYRGDKLYFILVPLGVFPVYEFFGRMDTILLIIDIASIVLKELTKDKSKK